MLEKPEMPERLLIYLRHLCISAQSNKRPVLRPVLDKLLVRWHNMFKKVADSYLTSLAHLSNKKDTLKEVFFCYIILARVKSAVPVR